MVELQDIISAAEKALRDENMFIVEVKARGDAFEVFLDADGFDENNRYNRVSLGDCVALARAIEKRFDREIPENNFSLTVSSAGIGQPLKVVRQYRRLIGHAINVVLTSGTKFTGTLKAFEAAADERHVTSLTFLYYEKQKVEGKQKAEMVPVTRTFPIAEVKSAVEYVDFK